MGFTHSHAAAKVGRTTEQRQFQKLRIAALATSSAQKQGGGRLYNELDYNHLLQIVAL